MTFRIHVFVSCVAAIAPMVGFGQNYRFRPLNTGLPADSLPFAYGINDFGAIVVEPLNPTSEVTYGSYLVLNGHATPLKRPAGAYYGAVNDLFQLVGTASPDSNGNTDSLLLDANGHLTQFGLPGAYATYPYGINNLGKVVGEAQSVSTVDNVTTYTTDGFFWQNGHFKIWDYPQVGGVQTYTTLTAINDDADFVGIWNNQDGQTGGFEVAHGQIEDINVSVAGFITTSVTPNGINDLGVVVGSVGLSLAGSTVPTYGFVIDHGKTSAYDYSTQEPQTIQGATGPLQLEPSPQTNFYAINNLGQIVGEWIGVYSSSATGESQTVYQPFIGDAVHS